MLRQASYVFTFVTISILAVVLFNHPTVAATTPTKNIYSGVAALDQHGEVTIELPASVIRKNDSFTYQAKSTGQPMPNLYLKSEMSDDRFTIAGGVSGGQIAWELIGTENHPDPL